MSEAKKIIIVAMTRDRVIGLDGKMPWHISDDLKLFKRITLGGTVVMGRTTYQSIGQPLPRRNNLVVSTNLKELSGVTVCPTFDEAVKKAEGFGGDIFFIGGASIYRQALPIADEMHVSWVKPDHAGDTYFPEFDLDSWQETEKNEYPDFVHIFYRRK